MTKKAAQVQNRRPLGLLLLTGLLLIVAAFVAVTFYLLARDARHEQAWVRLATEIQVSSQRLSKSAHESAGGNPAAFSELAASHQRISEAMAVLQTGRAADRLPRVAREVREELAQLTMSWQRMSENAQRILEQESLMRSLSDASDALYSTLPAIEDAARETVEALTQSGAAAMQIAAAAQQPALAERMLRRVTQILQGGSNAVGAARSLRGEIAEFDQVLTALRSGNASRGISRISNPAAMAATERMRSAFGRVQEPLGAVLDSATVLFEMRGAADEIFLDSRTVFSKAGLLGESIAALPHTRTWPSIATGVAGLAGLFILVALLVRSVITAERRRAAVATRRDHQTQMAIQRLLDELGSLANGDLTVQATVTEELTGEIATGVNYAIQRLRDTVTGINETARAVAESAELTRGASANLAEAAEQQALQMDAATEDIRAMATAFDTVAQRSKSSSEVAQKSVAIAHNGAEKVRETIKGMDLIREQIQETSKRIKRLGESTQEIGDIVSLINGIAEQTNVLALNAAIQAASAGGAGKGFAMVADEVQELAESAAQATRRIESLVHTIQADTSEAVHSMESTTSEVVQGAHLAEDAGAALQKIEAVSNDLSELIQEISGEAQSHSATATRISEIMHGVRDVSVENSAGSKSTAETIDQLAEQVLRLRESVSDFTLPERREPMED